MFERTAPRFVREKEHEELAQDLGLGALDPSDPLAAEVAGEAIRHFEQRRENDAYALNLRKKLSRSMALKPKAPAKPEVKLADATKLLTAVEKGLHQLGKRGFPALLGGGSEDEEEESDSEEEGEDE